MTTDPIKVSDVHVRVEFTAEAVHSLPGELPSLGPHTPGAFPTGLGYCIT